MSSIDNRKFFSPHSSLYEAPVHLAQYRGDETLEQKMFYQYAQPNQNIANDMYSYRYNNMMTGNRDVEQAIQPKFCQTKEIGAVCKKEEESQSVCGMSDDGVSNICGSGKKLAPIMNPKFNFREAAKNLILLEDHLFHESKSCEDCIKKHSLMIEGFLEEAITLDKTGEFNEMTNECLVKFRAVLKQIAEKIENKSLTNEECCKIAQQIRVIRKPLCQKFATFIK